MSDFEIKSVLVKYKGKGGKVIIPDSVTAIGDEAFRGCKSLTSVEIPSSVTSIEYGAFLGCKSLTSIKIPTSVERIEWRAFEGCKITKQNHASYKIQRTRRLARYSQRLQNYIHRRR